VTQGLSLTTALMGAGLVDRLQVTLFPVVYGQTGVHSIFQNRPGHAARQSGRSSALPLRALSIYPT
jgi:dihydrofolate reductase